MVKIKAYGHAVPETVMTNKMLEDLVDTNDEWIVSRTGIKERRILDKDMTSVDLSLEAINNMNEDLSDVGLIITATLTQDRLTPNTSNIIQARLGLNDKEVMCFDLNSACTGFVYALETAKALMLANKRIKKAIVVGTEILSRLTDYKDRNTCVLFGDGSGAVLIERSEQLGILDSYCNSKGDADYFLTVPRMKLEDYKESLTSEKDFMLMNGREVFKFATSAMVDAINVVLERNEMKMEDIDLIIPHQANVRIINKVAKTMDIDESKFYVNIHKYGNTSAASIAIALSEAVSLNLCKKGDNVLLVGFGGGLTWGSNIIKI